MPVEAFAIYVGMAKSLVEKHDTTARKPDNLDLTLIQHWEKLEQSFSSPDLIEEWGRLRVWGGNVGIISSRKNLEHGLHDSPHLRGVVNELMDSLWSIVEQRKSCTRKYRTTSSKKLAKRTCGLPQIT